MKNSSKTILSALCVCCCWVSVSAQSWYRPKIAEFSFESLYDYRTISQSESLGNANTEFENDALMNLKVGVPFYIKNGTIAGVQLKYARQKFAQEEDYRLRDYDLYQYLDQNTFTSLGARFFYSNPIEGTQGKLTALAGFELRSDKITWSRHTAKYFVTVGYDHNISRHKSIGGALLVDYSLGVFSVVPVFTYRNQFAENWALDMKLPKSIELRHRLTDKWRLVGKTQFRGWRYNLHNLDESNQGLMLRKSDLQITLSAEREIHDWLWLGVDFGLVDNLNFYLGETGDRRRDALATLRSKPSQFFKIGLFIVPPSKFY